MNITNLRDKLPQYDTPELEAEWNAVVPKITELGEYGVPCGMGIGSRRILFQTIRAMGAVDILDIGTYVGTSALTFALTSPEARVVSVDIHEQNFMWGPDYPYHVQPPFWVSAKRKQSPRHLMAAAGVESRVEFVRDDSVRYMTHTTRKFDFISIDGWHEQKAVYAEIPLALSLLKPGGVIFLDDVQPANYVPNPGSDHIYGPRKAIEQHVKEGAPFRVHYISESLDGAKNAVAFLTKE